MTAIVKAFSNAIPAISPDLDILKTVAVFCGVLAAIYGLDLSAGVSSALIAGISRYEGAIYRAGNRRLALPLEVIETGFCFWESVGWSTPIKSAAT